jgi:glycine cleavage system H protein
MSETYDVPADYFYTKDHEWIKSKSDSYLVGITDYAAKMLNDIVYVNLPKEGSVFNQKDVFGQVESVKTVSDLYMPVSGAVSKTNNQLTKTPELVANSPYVDGWMLEITSEKFSEESRDLLDAKSYNNYITSLKDAQ